MIKLYFIRNIGCDDETRGLARISDEDFPRFKEFIENLNKNSTCGCMPTIEVYEIDESMIQDNADGLRRDSLYLDDKKYKLIGDSMYDYDEDGVWTLKKGFKPVI